MHTDDTPADLARHFLLACHRRQTAAGGKYVKLNGDAKFPWPIRPDNPRQILFNDINNSLRKYHVPQRTAVMRIIRSGCWLSASVSQQKRFDSCIRRVNAILAKTTSVKPCPK